MSNSKAHVVRVAALLTAQATYNAVDTALKAARTTARSQVGDPPARSDRVAHRAWRSKYFIAADLAGETEALNARMAASGDLLIAFRAMMEAFATTPERRATMATLAAGWDDIISGSRRQEIIEIALAA